MFSYYHIHISSQLSDLLNGPESHSFFPVVSPNYYHNVCRPKFYLATELGDIQRAAFFKCRAFLLPHSVLGTCRN